MNDLHEWLALGRAARCGLIKLGEQYLDGGRRVPCFLPETLDTLVAHGLVTLADPDLAGQRRATLTDAGTARFTALRRTEEVHGMTSAPPRWVLSPVDRRSHLLADPATTEIGTVVALCGHLMPFLGQVSGQPPSREVCGTCQPLAGFEAPPPLFPTPTVF